MWAPHHHPTIRCVRCGVTKTCKWRLDGGDRVCNKCGLRAAGRRRSMPTCTLPALVGKLPG